MTDMGNPNDPESTGPPTDPAPSRPLAQLAGSPAWTERTDRTLADVIGALAQCEHPEIARSHAVVLEDDGSRLPIGWCGACGAIRVARSEAVEWVRPGVAELLREEKLLDVIARDLVAVVDGLAHLADVARGLTSPGGASGHDLGEILSLSEDLGHRARSAFGRMGIGGTWESGRG